ncbi:hypothetical protein [Nonomuraea sp. WAC 01424]|uniref:hypothetical protein n=1 Tax=Nonomuraea sp. WAC 01424 TaxID=2203200 RepID=UPI00163BCD07|nr:hypothetical protein [Nonomuraea sp. WAC 01424]
MTVMWLRSSRTGVCPSHVDNLWQAFLRRFDRPVMITTFLVSGCAMGTVPAAAVAGVLTLWQLYAVALVVATCEVFFTPAYQTYPLTLLGPDRLMAGNARLTSTVTVAGIVGQPVGGVLRL